MSIRNVFPTVRPSLNLNFARSRTLDPRITFSRTTTATYLDSDGLLKTATADEPRFDHKYENGNIVSLGLLIEGEETNIVRNSEDLTILSGRWSEIADGVTVTSNQAVAPDGNTTADKVAIKTSGSSNKGIQSSILTGTSSGTVITSSIFCKAAEHSYVRVDMEGGGAGADGIVVDLSDGSLITEVGPPDSYNIEPYPNDWYRISVTGTTASTAATALRVYLTDASGNAGWTGTIGDGVYMWGGQHEQNYYASSYIPTDDTFGGKTREPDNVSMTGTNFSDFYNQSEGTFYAEHRTGIGRTSGGKHVYSADVDFQNRISAQYASSGNVNRFNSFVRNSGTIYGVNSDDDTALGDVFNKTSHSYSSSVTTQTLNGNFVGIGSVPSGLPSPTILEIGKYMGSYDYLNGHIRKLVYYPKSVTNTQLQNLTK